MWLPVLVCSLSSEYCLCISWLDCSYPIPIVGPKVNVFVALSMRSLPYCLHLNALIVLQGNDTIYLLLFACAYSWLAKHTFFNTSICACICCLLFVSIMFVISYHVACESRSQMRRCETNPAAWSQDGDWSCSGPKSATSLSLPSAKLPASKSESNPDTW